MSYFIKHHHQKNCTERNRPVENREYKGRRSLQPVETHYPCQAIVQRTQKGVYEEAEKPHLKSISFGAHDMPDCISPSCCRNIFPLDLTPGEITDSSLQERKKGKRAREKPKHLILSTHSVSSLKKHEPGYGMTEEFLTINWTG